MFLSVPNVWIFLCNGVEYKYCAATELEYEVVGPDLVTMISVDGTKLLIVILVYILLIIIVVYILKDMLHMG